MKKFIVLLISCFWAFSLFADEVHESFEQYRTAILSGDGETAVQYLNQSSIDYYDDMLKDALYLKIINLSKIVLSSNSDSLRYKASFSISS